MPGSTNLRTRRRTSSVGRGRCAGAGGQVREHDADRPLGGPGRLLGVQPAAEERRGEGGGLASRTRSISAKASRGSTISGSWSNRYPRAPWSPRGGRGSTMPDDEDVLELVGLAHGRRPGRRRTAPPRSRRRRPGRRPCPPGRTGRGWPGRSRPHGPRRRPWSWQSPDGHAAQRGVDHPHPVRGAVVGPQVGTTPRRAGPGGGPAPGAAPATRWSPASGIAETVRRNLSHCQRPPGRRGGRPPGPGGAVIMARWATSTPTGTTSRCCGATPGGPRRTPRDTCSRAAAGPDLLDVGCGPGTITLDLAAPGGPRAGWWGWTPSRASSPGRRAAPAGGRRSPTSRFVTGDVYDLEFDEASFDVVHAHQVLQHLDRAGRGDRRDAPGAATGGHPGRARQRLRRLRLGSRRPAARPLARSSYHQVTAAQRGRGGRRAPPARMGPTRPASTDVRGRGARRGPSPTRPAGGGGAGLWADRVPAVGLRRPGGRLRPERPGELATIADAWTHWAAVPDGFFATLHGEVLARATGAARSGPAGGRRQDRRPTARRGPGGPPGAGSSRSQRPGEAM